MPLINVTFVVHQPLIGGSLPSKLYHHQMTLDALKAFQLGVTLAFPADTSSGIDGRYRINAIEQELETVAEDGPGPHHQLAINAARVYLDDLGPRDDTPGWLTSSAAARRPRVLGEMEP